MASLSGVKCAAHERSGCSSPVCLLAGRTWNAGTLLNHVHRAGLLDGDRQQYLHGEEEEVGSEGAYMAHATQHAHSGTQWFGVEGSSSATQEEELMAKLPGGKSR